MIDQETERLAEACNEAPPPSIDATARERLLAFAAEKREAEEAATPSIPDPHEQIEKLRPLMRSDAEVEAWNFENEVIPRLKESGFEARYHSRVENWNPDQRSVFDICVSECRGAGATIVLAGLRGTGKTTICAQLAILRAENSDLAPSHRSPWYRKLADIVARYKPIYSDFGSTQTDSLMSSRDTLCRQPLVFIDEINECEDLKLKSRMLTDIIDRRYSAKKDTILISNQTPEDFRASTSGSILSRMIEHGRIIPCNWQSFRQ